MNVTPGTRLRSAVCETEVVVVVARQPEVDLCCGGWPMLRADERPPRDATATDLTGTQVGKRYAHPESGLEVLCTRAGAGGLSIGEDPVSVKPARPLPSSD